ncbi:MAG: M20/M25/M40 family metallo-hydrolase, partial [Pandoraea sp.]|nr:M20/M25/M40 family metallo-hydrolase [Pandoraea sp.]
MSATNAPTVLRLNGAVLLQQLHELGEIGADPVAGGRTRVALTDAEKAGRDQVVAWMRELDLDVRIDRIGNIFGTLSSAAKDAAGEAGEVLRPLMMGSHIDTVVNAGALDGCYGVLGGLAIVRAFREAGVVPSRPITVAAFTNEEGARFHPDMMCSLVHAGG